MITIQFIRLDNVILLTYFLLIYILKMTNNISINTGCFYQSIYQSIYLSQSLLMNYIYIFFSINLTCISSSFSKWNFAGLIFKKIFPSVSYFTYFRESSQSYFLPKDGERIENKLNVKCKQPRLCFAVAKPSRVHFL